MRFKDKLVTTLLLLIILMLIAVIGVLGFVIYKELLGDKTVELNFLEEYSGIENKANSSKNLNNTDYSGVEKENTSSTQETTNERYRNLYDQLNKYSKVIYDQIYKHKEELKTGTYKIEFGNTFSELLSQTNGEKILQKNYQSAIEALIYENPELFYIDATKMYINIEKITKITGTKYNVYINQGNETNYLAKGFFSKEDIDASIKQIEKARDNVLLNVAGKSDYQKIKTIHDYLVDTIEYETTLQKNNIYNIYGALVDKTCVCEGYAKAFQYFMNELGIDNAIVIGTGENSKKEIENHAWNYVKLNGKWYAVDTTWDDPVLVGGGQITSKMKYQYFLKGSTTMNKNHTTSGQFTEGGETFTYPTLSVNDYE